MKDIELIASVGNGFFKPPSKRSGFWKSTRSHDCEFSQVDQTAELPDAWDSKWIVSIV